MKRFIVSVFLFVAFFAVSCGSGSGSASGVNGSESNTSSCGNGVIEGSEVCDGNVPCWQAGHFYPEFEAVCNSDCSAYDTSKCRPRDPSDNCGNGTKDSGESCEQGETLACTDLPNSKFSEGTATCRSDCRGWNTDNCSNGGKTKTCAQILACVVDCKGDSSCESNCKNLGTQQGSEAYSALESCASACSGVADEECLKKTCYDAYYACNPTQKCGNKVIDEGEICENKDTKPCQELNTEDTQWQPINEAICNSSCDGWDTYSCVDVNKLTCYQVYECTNDCTDSNCEADCFAKTWPAAKGKYDALVECLEANCPVVTEECISGSCKFQMDACKTHLTCGNGNIDKDMGEICEKNEFKDCGEIKDENGEAMYEAGTGSAFCGPNCTDFSALMCHKFCSCAEIQTCIEQECGGYPKSNAENTEEKQKCMSACEDLGSEIGEGEAKGYRDLIESCYDNNGNTAWDSDTCKDQAPSQAEWTCGSEDNPKCPY